MIHKIAAKAIGLTAILLWINPIVGAASAGGVGCGTNMSNSSGIGAFSPQGVRPTGHAGGKGNHPHSATPPAPPTDGNVVPAGSAPAPAPPTASGPQAISPTGSAGAGGIRSLNLPSPVETGTVGGNPKSTPLDRTSAVKGRNNNVNPQETGNNLTTNNNAPENSQAKENNTDSIAELRYTESAIELSRRLSDRLVEAQAKYDAAVAKLAEAKKSNNPTDIAAARVAETETKNTLNAIKAEIRQLLDAVKNGDPAVIQRVKPPTVPLEQPTW